MFEQVVLRFGSVQAGAVVVRLRLEARGALVRQDLGITISVVRLASGGCVVAAIKAALVDIG